MRSGARAVLARGKVRLAPSVSANIFQSTPMSGASMALGDMDVALELHHVDVNRDLRQPGLMARQGSRASGIEGVRCSPSL
jgi:hypothetical protein